MAEEIKENSINIPAAQFVEDVEAFLKHNNNISSGDMIQRLDETHSKYKLMEQNLVLRKAKLNEKIPDFEANLDALKYLRLKNEKKEEFEANYMLDFHVYTRATIPPTDKVGLWLGANVMLEYSIDEAEALLKKNLEDSRHALLQLETDLDFLKDQITTTEVNIARVYNYDVRARKAKETAKA